MSYTDIFQPCPMGHQNTQSHGGLLPELQQALGSSHGPLISGLRVSKCFSKTHLGLPATTLETVLHNKRSNRNEKPPLTATREKPAQQQQRELTIQHKERYLVHSGDLNGKETKRGGMHVSTWLAHPLCTETDPTL